MAKSTEFIRFNSPVDYFNHQVELKSANTLNARPGMLLVLDANGLAVLCDATIAAHRVLPPFVSNLDTANRDDANDAVVSIDGTTQDSITAVASGSFDVRMKVDPLIANTGTNGQPALGDYIVKSLTTPGRMETLTSAQIDALVVATTISRGDVEGFTVGRVISAPDPDGWFRARLFI